MVRIVLQARVGATRLPGKTLLPLAGMPGAVLTARRAASCGDEVIAALAEEPLAPLLKSAFEGAGVRVCMGPLRDVLARFAAVISDVPDDVIVVRLTADNPLPDGDLIREVVAVVEHAGDVYAEIAWPGAGMPYGIAVEAFRAKALREAAALATEEYDHEHVTPWIIRNRRTIAVKPSGTHERDYAALRCTLDNFDDYERLSMLFAPARSAEAPWHELVRRLATNAAPGLVPQTIEQGLPASRVILGTAQLGSAYGVTNRVGDPGDSGALAIVNSALSHGMTVFDTARGYDRSEERLGKALAGPVKGRGRIITKLDHSLVCPIDDDCARAAVDASVYRSMAMLRTTRLDTLLLHRWAQRSVSGGAVWRRLLELRDAGLIGRLGVSVLEPREALDALTDQDVRVVQLPFNILDHRWQTAGVPDAVMSRPDVAVHARSVFLQGLLLAPADAWPALIGVDALGIVDALEDAVSDTGFESCADLCIAYALCQPWIDAIVVGVDDVAQLAEIARLAERHVDRETVDWRAILESLPPQPDHVLDPWRWPAP